MNLEEEFKKELKGELEEEFKEFVEMKKKQQKQEEVKNDEANDNSEIKEVVLSETDKNELNNSSNSSENNYKNNYTYPIEDSLENQLSNGELPYEIKKVEETKIQQLFKKSSSSIDDELIDDIPYRGKITNIKVIHEEIFSSLQIMFELLDEDGLVRRVKNVYTFGGQYDDWNMNLLTNFISKIEGFYLGQVDSTSLETIAKSLEFLKGANIMLIQSTTSKGKKAKNVTVLGNYQELYSRKKYANEQ